MSVLPCRLVMPSAVADMFLCAARELGMSDSGSRQIFGPKGHGVWTVLHSMDVLSPLKEVMCLSTSYALAYVKSLTLYGNRVFKNI